MERLTDCAQGYCEMYCKKYGHCFGDPGDCIFKDEIKLYEAVKSIEGIVPFDRLLELADADRAGRLVVLPCKVGDIVYGAETAPVLPLYVIEPAVYMESAEGGDFETLDNFGKMVFMTREEAEAAMALKGGEGNA